MLSLLLAAALFQADPAAAQTPAAPVPAASQAIPTQPGASPDDSDTPKGAPVGTTTSWPGAMAH